MKIGQMLILFTFLLTLAVGCQQTNDDTRKGNVNNNEGEVEVEQTEDHDKGNPSYQEIADHLANVSSRKKGVNDATAVVAGQYAVVGLDLDQNLDRSDVGTTKYAVAKALKEDPYGANAVITADADTVERLREMNEQIRAGRPVQGFMDELSQIVGRLMPEIPNDLNDEPTKNEKDKLNNQEQKDMEKQQNKQKQQRSQ